MKNILNIIKNILPHGIIVLSLVIWTLLILNIRNPFMGFISGSMTLWLIAIYCALSFAGAIILIYINRHD